MATLPLKGQLSFHDKISNAILNLKVKVLATQLTWLSFMLVRLAGQNTLTAISQIILFARLLLNPSNTLDILGFYLGRSPQFPRQLFFHAKLIQAIILNSSTI